jgi:hypothetical protein
MMDLLIPLIISVGCILGLYLLVYGLRQFAKEEEGRKEEIEARKEDRLRKQIEEEKRLCKQIEEEKRLRRQIEEERLRRQVEEKIKTLIQDTANRLKGSWFGNNREGSVEIVFEGEKRLTIIRNQTDVMSLLYKIQSINDGELLLQVDGESRVSEVKLRFMTDGSGRLHFKSPQLEMVLVKK